MTRGVSLIDSDDGGAQEMLSRIEDLQADERYDFAADTLSGIYETIERTQRVTEGQRRAIDNIEFSRS